MITEDDARQVFWRAATLTRDGDVELAAVELMRACGIGPSIFDQMPAKDEVVGALRRGVAIILVGADICAITARAAAGDPNPLGTPSDTVYAMHGVWVTEGTTETTGDENADPSMRTAIRCISYAMNHDIDMMSALLKAHAKTHGADSMLEIIADLIIVYLSASGLEVDTGIFDDTKQGRYLS